MALQITKGGSRGERSSVPLDAAPDLRIRAIAISAPECISGCKSGRALNSTDPVSLFNACRCAASLAQESKGAWANSNWGRPDKKLREHFLLMYSLDDLHRLENLIHVSLPNILFIGAMTLCMPGAVECAKLARKMLGSRVLIILGGRHINETIYLSDERRRSPSLVKHHRASPGRLIRELEIPPLFDVIISGEAEKLIAEIGELFSRSNQNPTMFIAENLNTKTEGRWIADFPHIDKTLVSDGNPLKHDDLPSVVGTFGVTASFDVFQGRMTSHVFSDTGPGCIYDCNFCSERRSIAGNIQEIQGAPRRLYNQLKETIIAVKQDHPNKGASAFVEDSILLSGSPVAIAQLCQLLEKDPLEIVFGGQFTIDQILRKKDIIKRLAKCGLRYIFIGLETLEPQEIGGMSKDVDGKKRTWRDRFLEALDFMAANHIACGCALLFGLGEAHNSRRNLLNGLIALKRETGQPVALSANWAVQHPLRSCRESENENYLRWGTPEGELLECFHRFGEASLEYPLPNVSPPQTSEVKEIIHLLNEFEATDA
ncbi:B12-binding domain/radical SAM domain-containing protein [Pseudomonas sp. NPDC089743]|uniref:B12-binding domain/radical SAM domain-containing protein n=1 Tax=Pseudomonas sp. NPDC089743 TaxID=3364471 RepID=UPI0037F5A593